MSDDKKLKNGLIWISGYSASGKTTVGRLLVSELRHRGHPVIFLDGDDLRSIFSGKWGYERQDRIELAKVYFKLSNHLVAQGNSVVISAVAMYKEIREWVKDNISGAIEIYLDVPEDERLIRDSITKNIYSTATPSKLMYDPPSRPDLAIDNFGDTPLNVARKILDFYLSIPYVGADLGRTKHWSGYYSTNLVPSTPSSFSVFAFSNMTKGKLLEIGCGNGRDAFYFDENGLSVVATDMSADAIKAATNLYSTSSIDFKAGRVYEIFHKKVEIFDYIYSRFVLHAMPLAEEVATLELAFDLLKPGGSIFIECRSINDPLARKGDVISPTERIFGHYRRFIHMNDLLERLKLIGFEIKYCVESNGLAVFQDDDPVVIRVVAIKPIPLYTTHLT